MSIKELLEELPNLTQEEKRELWNALLHEVSLNIRDETPEVLAADRGMDEGDWKLLLERIRDKECLPILGPGACRGLPPEGVDSKDWHFEAPLSAEFTRSLAREFGYPFEDETRLERVAQFIAIGKGGATPKTRVAWRHWGSTPPDFSIPNEPHRVLADLELPVYLTSNFDDFLFHALRYKQQDASISICRWNQNFPTNAPAYDRDSTNQSPFFIQNPAWSLAEEKDARLPKEGQTLKFIPRKETYLSPTRANPLVYHFHGHYRYKSSLVLTETDYFDFLVNLSREEQSLLPLIPEKLSSNSILFLGYRLYDWDFMVLLRFVSHFIKDNKDYRHVAVQLSPQFPATDAQSIAKAKRAAEYLKTYFGGLSFSVYWGTCQQFVAELRRKRNE